MIYYYVDPGSGFVFAQNASLVWGILLGLLGTFALFFKLFFRFLKRAFLIFLVLLSIFIIGGAIMHKSAAAKKVVVLGIDAMDPAITERLMQEGRLPNFERLKASGAYARLKTTVPPESVVAWTTFLTGLNPGSHGVYDFIMRDPKTYFPYLSLNGVSTAKGKTKIEIFRKGDAFWKTLSRNNIPCFIYFCPNTFPPEAIRQGKMLSGMGVPDITGTMGKLSFYTTRPLSPEDAESRGRIIHIELKNNVVETSIYGPRVELRGSVAESAVPLKMQLVPGGKDILLQFQGNRLLLRENTWSDWQTVSFRIGQLKKMRGIARFYCKAAAPDVEVYMSPINFDPRQPYFPISYPNDFSKGLAKKTGLFYTQGMPHDTWALTEGRINEDAFLEQTDMILEERRRIAEEELKTFKKGVFFFYIETLDSIQHMFWRYTDPRSALYEEHSRYKDTIAAYYEKIDGLLGDILKAVDKDTTLIVFSDHGFSSSRRVVHLNRWLLENQYLFLKNGVHESREFFEDVDWSKTKAYALGFGGVYLNRVNREYRGIVTDAEARDLKKTMSKQLEQLQDPESKEMAVKKVYSREEVFQGPYANNAPDLFVGFNAGYRVSWQTALGGTPTGAIMEDNRKKWSGDHLIDPSIVPGVVFINHKTALKEPAIVDIAPTILHVYSIHKPEEMQGESLFKDTVK